MNVWHSIENGSDKKRNFFSSHGDEHSTNSANGATKVNIRDDNRYSHGSVMEAQSSKQMYSRIPFRRQSSNSPRNKMLSLEIHAMCFIAAPKKINESKFVSHIGMFTHFSRWRCRFANTHIFHFYCSLCRTDAMKFVRHKWCIQYHLLRISNTKCREIMKIFTCIAMSLMCLNLITSNNLKLLFMLHFYLPRDRL